MVTGKGKRWDSQLSIFDHFRKKEHQIRALIYRPAFSHKSSAEEMQRKMGVLFLAI